MKKLLLTMLLGFFALSFGGQRVTMEADCYKCLQKRTLQDCKERGECPEHDDYERLKDK